MNGILFSFNDSFIAGDKYITNDLGDVFIQINILGHVLNPGSHIIYENADFMTAISKAGGFLPGANLKKIKILKTDSTILILSIEDFLSNGGMVELKLEPNDTIYIEQKISSYLFSNSNLINSLLQVLNIILLIATR